MVKPGAVVVDVGINRIKGPDGKGKTVGDVAEDVWDKAEAVSPVPGGVGAVTTTILLEAAVQAAEALAAEDASDGTDLTELLSGAGLHLNPEQAAGVARLLSRHIVHQPGQFGFKSAFKRRLEEGAILFDGAVSTELIAAGLSDDQLSRAQLDHSDILAEVHQSYVDAGVDIITANTFAANRYRQNGHSLQATLLAQAGVRVARGVAQHRAWVYGSIGPTGTLVGAEISEQQAEDAFAESAIAMGDAGVDGFIIETMPTNREAACALRGVRRASQLPVVVCRNFARVDRQEIEAFTALCHKHGATAIGVNCITGLRSLRELVRLLASLTDLPIAARPNGGFPQRRDGALHYNLQKEYFVEHMLAAVSEGAALVGGCCGVGPSHIAALKPALATAVIGESSNNVVANSDHEAPAIIDTSDSTSTNQSPFVQQLVSGSFPIMALHAVRSDAAVESVTEQLTTAGVGALGYLSAWPGAEPLPRIAARTRRLADRYSADGIVELVAGEVRLRDAQNYLLEAHLLGFTTVIIDTGLLAAGSTQGATAVELLELVKNLNARSGADGATLAEATNFSVGVRICEAALERLPKIMQVGCDFISVQPIYSPQRFRNVIAACPQNIPLLAEVLVLPDADTAREVANEMPDLAVPQRLVDRLAADPTEDIRGVESFLEAWRERLSGVIVLVPEGGGAAAETVIRTIYASSSVSHS